VSIASGIVNGTTASLVIGITSSSGGYTIPAAGIYAITNKTTNDASIGTLTADTFIMHLWFKPDTAGSWTGSRALAGGGTIIEGAAENLALSARIFRATTGAANIFVTVTGTADLNLDIDFTTTFMIPNTAVWHRLCAVYSPRNFYAGATLDGTGPMYDEFFMQGIQPVCSWNSFQTNGFGEYEPGSGFFLAGMQGNYADVYFSNSSYTTNLDQVQTKFATAGGQPINIGNGVSITGTAPQVFYNNWSSVGTTLANAGTGGTADVSPANISSTTGPSQWGVA
jgi:hypothetical protein